MFPYFILLRRTRDRFEQLMEWESMAVMLVISPAKRMDVVEGPPFAQTRPAFLADAQSLARELRSLGYEGARSVWHCSDALARPNWERLATMPEDMAREPRLLSPATLTYVGIQYQHLAPQVMTERELLWLTSHLRILSGMYGILRPFDGVIPYRLEMQAKLAVGGCRDLYEFWGERLLDSLLGDGADVIVNVASQEYAKAVVPWAQRTGAPVVTCVFGEVRASDGHVVQRATEAKAARGAFVRWCAETGAEKVEQLMGFSERGYRLDRDRSDAETLTFVRG